MVKVKHFAVILLVSSSLTSKTCYISSASRQCGSLAACQQLKPFAGSHFVSTRSIIEAWHLDNSAARQLGSFTNSDNVITRQLGFSMQEYTQLGSLASLQFSNLVHSQRGRLLIVLQLRNGPPGHHYQQCLKGISIRASPSGDVLKSNSYVKDWSSQVM